MEKLRKEGFIQIAEWMVASFIIIFILLVFSAISSMLIFSKTVQKSLSPSEISFKQEGFVDIASAKSFENFARFELEINGEKKKVFEVVAEADVSTLEIQTKFKEKASEFLGFVKQNKYSGGWIGVYDTKEELIQDYQVSSGVCDINSKNSVVYKLFFADNQIVLCLEPK